MKAEDDAPPDPWGYAEVLLWAVTRDADVATDYAGQWRKKFPDLQGQRAIEEMTAEQAISWREEPVRESNEPHPKDDKASDGWRSRFVYKARLKRSLRDAACGQINDAWSMIQTGHIRGWQRMPDGQSLRLKAPAEFPEIERRHDGPGDEQWQAWVFSKKEVMDALPGPVHARFRSLAAFVRGPQQLREHLLKIGQPPTLGRLAAAMAETWGADKTDVQRELRRQFPSVAGGDRLAAILKRAKQGAK